MFELPDNTEQILHLNLKVLLTDFTGQKIHQTEVTLNDQLTTVRTIVPLVLIVTTTIGTGEGVNIEGDVDLGTEPNQIVELFDGVFHLVTHRTRPVKNKDQTVVLTVRNNIDLLEEIFVELVGVKFGTIQNTSTRGRRTAV